MELLKGSMQNLSDISIGKFVRVKNLFSKGLVRERMLALGFTKGAIVEVIQRGPTGDPTIYNIRGTMIALRKEEASLIDVTLD